MYALWSAAIAIAVLLACKNPQRPQENNEVPFKYNLFYTSIHPRDTVMWSLYLFFCRAIKKNDKFNSNVKYIVH